MNEKRMQQIINDKRALDELRARGYETSPDESRSPTERLREIAGIAIEEAQSVESEV